MKAKGKEVCIGVVGAGYAANLHGKGYEKVCRVPFRLKTICDVVPEKAEAFKKRYGIEQVEVNFDKIAQDPEIDIVDIITPPTFLPKKENG